MPCGCCRRTASPMPSLSPNSNRLPPARGATLAAPRPLLAGAADRLHAALDQVHGADRVRAAIGDEQRVAGDRQALRRIELGVLEGAVGEAADVAGADDVAHGSVEPAD